MVAVQCVDCQLVDSLLAARWNTWALVRTSSGIVDTGILATNVVTG